MHKPASAPYRDEHKLNRTFSLHSQVSFHNGSRQQQLLLQEPTMSHSLPRFCTSTPQRQRGPTDTEQESLS
ncbi:Uncharacterised protein [uncultured Comamonas sp.]|nr:Uncharacterised protein [uncultured Comamonas sp.]